MITYQVESLADARTGLEALLPLHWAEIARDQDVIKLAPDWKAYEALDFAGQFHLVAAREAGRMIGYHASFIRPHLHYVNSLSAFVDVYYMLPDRRSGLAGYRLLQEAERTLKARGVQKIFSGTKVYADLSPIYHRLGYHLTEHLFTKVL